MKKVLLSWSSGKDSAWTLWQLQQDPEIEVLGLFSTVNEEFDRVAMHAVRVELVKQQAAAADLPVEIIKIPYPCSNKAYALVMTEFIETVKKRQIDAIAFGDLFLEDIRDYRINNLKNSGIEPIFPLWGEATNQLAVRMITAGLRARITCIDPKVLSKDFAGHEYDQRFIDKLPPNVDACGEYGEFHSFAYAGPMFKHEIKIKIGETVERDNFVFTDLLPA